MTAAITLNIPRQSSDEVPLQPASLDIWEQKYRLKDRSGQPVDQDIDGSYQRVARALSDVESTPELRTYWYEQFLWALRHGAIPAGRILSNAGALEHKPATSTINCTVSDTVNDSMDGILSKLYEAGITLKSGAGIGYEFSTLRPKGAYVSGAGAHTSGPLSFMDIFDKMCFTISSAGGRRGAQMATFDVGHPDVFDFIRVKREDGRLRQFNLSLLIRDEFMQAVINDTDWALAFPVTAGEADSEKLDLNDPDKVVWREWPTRRNYVSNEAGQVACRIYRKVRASELWNAIMRSTYDFAEPGFILIDKYNEMNNNWFCENIRATNPCGEQGLPPYGACLLGSINLTQFVRHPFTDKAEFDWDEYRKVVKVFTRMLDNVVEQNGLPLPQQQNEITRKRRHGMGFLGLGSALTMMRIAYGSDASLVFTESVTRELAITGWQTALELSDEKGPAPIMEEDFTVTEEMLRHRPEMRADGWQVGQTIKGKQLHARYSRYMQKIAEVEPELVSALAEKGARFTHHSSIAPTGTISLSLANNASNGIEPSFAHHYSRNVIRSGKKTKEKVDVFSYELLAYRHLVNDKAMPFSDVPDQQLPDYFVSADNIAPRQHVDVQAASQKWIDSSISKTANVPTDFPYEEFKEIYLYAYQNQLKGCTTFRFNPEAFQGVLVKKDDLDNTIYRFVLEDGTEIEARGNEEIEYDGELHTAANLHDALKEGYYGKF
ncbi:MAG: adenosylcobalamin-dependent ribonucleoside-diphosphate reductase [Gammaproteobacteria bacterium]|nr:adenosylcobalamin-dependent ribonucleoside-diphosphate reductase [Gammaproteobacteria bacterium]